MGADLVAEETVVRGAHGRHQRRVRGQRVRQEQGRIEDLQRDPLLVHGVDPLLDAVYLHAADGVGLLLRVGRLLAVVARRGAEVVGPAPDATRVHLLLDHPVDHLVDGHHPRLLGAERRVEVLVAERGFAFLDVSVGIHQVHESPPVCWTEPPVIQVSRSSTPFGVTQQVGQFQDCSRLQVSVSAGSPGLRGPPPSRSRRKMSPRQRRIAFRAIGRPNPMWPGLRLRKVRGSL